MSSQKSDSVHSEWSNQELADVFERIANLLEIKGDVIYKIRAYQRAAESLRAEPRSAAALLAEGKLDEIPGVGKAISEKIEELITTGKLEFLEQLEQEIPPSLLELLQVPDVGPKRAALLWKQAGITDLAGLEAAAREHRLSKLPGLGEKSEARILAGIEALGRRTGRMSLDVAWAHAQRWMDWLRQQPEVQRVEPGGSLRRWRETIGDLDLIAASDHPEPLMERFIHHPDVQRVKGHGENKSSVELRNGVHIQLWAQPPQRFGTLWVYATGSKAHNVRLRELALKRQLSLSERGFEDASGRLMEYATEEEVYAVLDLPWIPPELREDHGEIEAALKGQLPELIETRQIQAELHSHTTWSDGALSVEGMARAAIERGLRILAITDHSGTLGITGGLKAEQLPAQRAEIEQVQARLGKQIKLLHGIEVDIMADGSLGFADEVLAGLDIVIASLHSSLRQPRETITARLVRAIRNPHVDLIAHPSGRLLPNREGADLDWDTVLAEAKAHGVALEINANPHRLDLTDLYARRALELGIPLAINTDAHSPGELDLARYGAAVARRAWVGPEQVLNTWTVERLTRWLAQR